MLQVMKDIGGVELPETLARFESASRGSSGSNGSAPPDAPVTEPSSSLAPPA